MGQRKKKEKASFVASGASGLLVGLYGSFSVLMLCFPLLDADVSYM